MAKLFMQFLALCLVGLASSQYAPSARLYASTNCGGAFVVLPTNTFVPDLSVYGFDNRAYSVALRGAWLFYDTRTFNDAGNALMEYVFQASETCVNFFDIGGYVTSVRFAGHGSDYRRDSISFYEITYFQAEEEYIEFDIPNSVLYGRTASLIITGSSSWTIYDRSNYGGAAICLQVEPSPYYEPAFVPDTIMLDPTVPHGAIASVRRGCFTENIRVLKRGVAGIHEKSVFVNPTFSN